MTLVARNLVDSSLTAVGLDSTVARFASVYNASVEHAAWWATIDQEQLLSNLDDMEAMF